MIQYENVAIKSNHFFLMSIQVIFINNIKSTFSLRENVMIANAFAILFAYREVDTGQVAFILCACPVCPL